ncbi:hypothetical protein D3C75_1299330 [compost metagenome]
MPTVTNVQGFVCRIHGNNISIGAALQQQVKANSLHSCPFADIDTLLNPQRGVTVIQVFQHLISITTPDLITHHAPATIR